MICRLNEEHTFRFNYIHYGSNVPSSAWRQVNAQNPNLKINFINQLDSFLNRYNWTIGISSSKTGTALRMLNLSGFRVPNPQTKILSKLS